jgi:GNAT superfamily N-acetyltransferase
MTDLQDRSITIRHLQPDEVEEAHALVETVFDAAVAPHYTAEGVREFKAFIAPGNLANQLIDHRFILVAERDAEFVGLIAMRDYDHISLLFVDLDVQRQGIARALLDRALAICRRERPDLGRVTVNASPNAVTAYRRMGFARTQDEQLANGIRFVPMARPVDPPSEPQDAQDA